MADLFRSAEMSFLQAIVPEEVVKTFVHQLALSGVAEIVDMNGDQSAFQRRFTKEIMRVAEIDRKASVLEGMLIAHEVPYVKPADAPVSTEEPSADILDQVERIVDKYFNDVNDVARVVADLEANLEQAVEFDHVLIHTGRLLRHRIIAEEAFEEKRREEMRRAAAFDQKDQEMMIELEAPSKSGPANPAAAAAQQAADVGFQYLAGVVPKALHPVLERQVFLVSRGNCFTFFQELEGDESKVAFILFFLGSTLRRKLTKICETLGVRLYLYPENANDVTAQRNANSKQINDLKNVLVHTKKQQSELFAAVAARFGSWKRKLVEEKAVYSALNKMRTQARNLVCNMWVPTLDQPLVQQALNKAVEGRGVAPPVLTPLETRRTPPTYFKLNDFTRTFQGIVNTYGVPRYQEVNPALFTIITFPFLFGMMYGDIGHGFFLCLFGCYLIYNQKKFAKAASEDEMAGTLFGGRYLLAMMGAFGVYVGLCYNDFMALSVNLFGSHWHFEDPDAPGAIAKNLGGVYTFGVDPAWHDTVTELAFYNSLKMKLSVIFGITQMTFGLILSLMNHLHFNNWLGIWCEFIPQMIFMLSLFGYMIALILTKWSIDWSIPYVNGNNPDGTPCPADPPNLITTMINMFLNPGVVECKSLLYEGQAEMQASLVSFAFIAVPWILIPKPLILYLLHWKEQNERPPSPEHELLNGEEHKHEEEEEGGDDHGHGHGGKFDFGGIMIHQMIHAIEFVLGTVSNTASYLRLWALSLAHAELAKVFFEKVLYASWMTGSPVAIVIGIGAFFGVTFAVLMCMDVLECFLHALRLHWVEFQNKFYFADGVSFMPFSYEAAMLEDADK